MKLEREFEQEEENYIDKELVQLDEGRQEAKEYHMIISQSKDDDAEPIQTSNEEEINVMNTNGSN